MLHSLTLSIKKLLIYILLYDWFWDPKVDNIEIVNIQEKKEKKDAWMLNSKQVTMKQNAGSPSFKCDCVR